MDEPRGEASVPRAELHISARFVHRLIVSCLAIEILFVLADYHVNYRQWIEAGSIRHLSSLTHGTSLASWFGVTQLLLIGLTVWLIYLLARQLARPRRTVLGWLAAAVCVSLLVIDEGASLHRAIGASLAAAYPGSTWQLLLVPFLVVHGGLIFLFLWLLWHRLESWASRRLLIVAACCFLAATGLEIVGDLDPGSRWNPYTWLTERFDLASFTEGRFGKPPYRVLQHFGEALGEYLEMLGGTLLWWPLLTHVRRLAPRVELRLDGPRVRRSVRVLIGCCIAVELALLLVDHLLGHGPAAIVEQVRELFDLTLEESLGSWFGTAQTTLIALTLWLLFAVSESTAVSRWTRRGWLVLAVGFTYLSADDGALIHERVGSAVQHGGAFLDAFPSYSWLILFVPVFAALGLFALVFLWRQLDRRVARWAVLAALACMALAVGLDFLDGLEADHPWSPYSPIVEAVDIEDYTRYRFREMPFDTLVHLSRALEEFLEMLGMTLIWFAILDHATRRPRLARPPG